MLMLTELWRSVLKHRQDTIQPPHHCIMLMLTKLWRSVLKHRQYTIPHPHHWYWQSCQVTYLPEVSCTLGSAPASSSNLATSAMPERVEGGVTSGLKQATMCSGVSLSRNVAMLGSTLLLIRNLAENSSPEEQIVCLYLSTSSCVWQVEQEQGAKRTG